MIIIYNDKRQINDNISYYDHRNNKMPKHKKTVQFFLFLEGQMRLYQSFYFILNLHIYRNNI